VNDADKKKLQTALMTITTLEGKLEDLMGRGPGAVKFWAGQAATNKGMTDKQRQTLKATYVPGMTKLVKDAKVVLKDLNSLYKEGSDAKVLASFATGKEFRDKAATKRLATMKAFDQSAAKFVLALTSFFGPGDTDYPGMAEAAVKPAVAALKGATTYYNTIRIDLAKL
jgi:hypothetical protein